MKIISTTNVRNNFQDVVNEVHYTKEPVLIVKRSKPWALIKPLPEEDGELSSLIQDYKDRVITSNDVEKELKKQELI